MKNNRIYSTNSRRQIGRKLIPRVRLAKQKENVFIGTGEDAHSLSPAFAESEIFEDGAAIDRTPRPFKAPFAAGRESRCPRGRYPGSFLASP
jgi:hypothetical protein